MDFLVCKDGCFSSKNINYIKKSTGGPGYQMFMAGNLWHTISDEGYQEITASISALKKIEELKEKIEELKAKNRLLKQQILYAPGGPGYLQAQEDFNRLAKD